MATKSMTTAAGATELLYFTLNRKLQSNPSREDDEEGENGGGVEVTKSVTVVSNPVLLRNSEKASECMAKNTNKDDLPFEVDAQQEGRERPKDVKDPVTKELAKFNQAKGKEIARKQDEKSRSVTKSVPLQQETVTTDETLHQTGSGISLYSIERKDQEGDVKDDGKGTITIETPTNGLIARIKRQRDDVDALLPSAFIPLKKIGTIQKSESVKRPRSPPTSAVSGAQIKPPKPKKGTLACC